MLAIIGGLALPVYGSVPLFGEAIFPSNKFRVMSEQFLKLFFKTIGVVIDCIQSFSKSVMNFLGKMDNIGPLLLILSDEHASYLPIPIINGWAIGTKMFARNKTSADDTVAYHEYKHSKKFSRIQIPAMHGAKDRNPVDSQNRSPLKHNRAGLYEKRDYNQ